MLAANIGTWMYRVGQSWLTLALTDSALMLGAVTALQFLPMLLVGPWAGVLADRHDRRRLLMLTQAALAIQALLLAVLTLAGLVTPVLLLGAAAVLGLITALDGPARASIVSDLVPTDQVVNAVSLNSASLNVARLVGPALAGLVIAATSTGWVFLIATASFTAMVGALSGISTSQRPSGGRRPGGVRDGLRHVRANPDLLFVIALAGLVSMFALNFQLTTALMSTHEFHAGPVVFGILGSVMAIGSLAGSLLSARRSRTDLRIIAGAALALSVSTIIAGFAPNEWFFGVALTLCGISALTMMTGANSYLQTRTDDSHRSRVLALYLAVFFGTTPIGAPLVGLLAEWWGPRVGLVVPGILAVIVTVVLWLRYSEDARAAARDRALAAV
ncbi:MAG: MFS transporter [Candidatus Nanopelagicales bacterium]